MYILILSVHGLIRGRDLELGRDADTGGQVTYVVELARALARREDVKQVDVLTRLISDPAVASDYSQSEEALAEGARILRVPFGPSARYVRKELLWPHLDQMVDRCLGLLRQQDRLPDLIHSHYADAGYVGRQLSLLLGVPQAHTSHSLGRVKRERLLASGRKEQAIERQFNLSQRISVEDDVFSHASLVIASTQQETEEQLRLYSNHRPRRLVVIPPGADTARFSPPGRQPISNETAQAVDRFLVEPRRPLILAIARPVEGKNFKGLVAAYGEDKVLQDMANLAIVAGNRHDIRELEKAQQHVLRDLLLDIDRYDIWGKVALPKHHSAEHIPDFYRLAARRKGVFVNPSLVELFGLALVEAAASGLPVVATENGGPRDIIANCRNGLLVDPSNSLAIAEALKRVLQDKRQWRRWSENGIRGAYYHYSWEGHAAKFVKEVQRLLHRDRKRLRRQQATDFRGGASVLPLARQLLISDVDDTLLGDADGLQALLTWLHNHVGAVGFGVATGRTVESTVGVLKKWHVPLPDVLITSVGSEIHYGSKLIPDAGWAHHVRYRWRRDVLTKVFEQIPGLRLQRRQNQREFKLSYNVQLKEMPPLEYLMRMIHGQGLHAQLIFSQGKYLDVLPVRASKGHAIRYLAYKWGIPVSNCLVAGDSGNDLEMLRGDTLAVVVGNHSSELNVLHGADSIYFSKSTYANGILEGLYHYDFDDQFDE